MSSPQFIHSIFEKIDDSKTFSNFEHYGANFTNVEDHGTAHISVIATNGDVVSVTSTIND
jgi:gamma-glutamyltranspeptidase / glutathione hydrolase / leukotriene-C4 hydrolase